MNVMQDSSSWNYIFEYKLNATRLLIIINESLNFKLSNVMFCHRISDEL